MEGVGRRDEGRREAREGGRGEACRENVGMGKGEEEVYHEAEGCWDGAGRQEMWRGRGGCK